MMKEELERTLSTNGKTNRLRVLYIYKDFDIYNGLIETFLILSKEKLKLPFDFEVCVFRNKENDYSDVFKKNGGILVNLNNRWGSNPFIIFSLYKLFKSRRPDIVQTFVLKPNLFGIIAAIMAKVPVVIATDLTLKDQAPSKLRRLRDKFLYKIYVFLANRANHVICVSDTGRDELKALGVDVDISVIPPPIDIERMRRPHEGVSNRSDRNQLVVTIGIVARLSEEKRHSDLFEAFSLLSEKFPRLQLLIVGDGPIRDRLEVLTEKLRIDEKVTFVGFQKDVQKYLDVMDIFVLPSRTEGLPIAIMEAMAMGLPVVASRVGGIPEIVDDQVTGLLFDSGDVEQLSNRLSQLIENPEKRNELGENGKKKIYQSYHPDRFIGSHYKLYQTLLDR